MDIYLYAFAAFIVGSLLWFVTRKNVKKDSEGWCTRDLLLFYAQ